ncbi:glycoside hydrolase family 88/105 protein [Autumnicola psychrophila]|uniref:Glycoside hydrolase family 88 protein n=1 Tax=Autumnicola psychrophila TaxID=3075592 RepID=A0ABU3DUL1_9FLAO|nr:glycoside hydrolase family 88 protein [Zunongwangia sp. F225]MDT0687405.1 glycoside hydrolase family 88 protein [Zunongwangia sp. F225]
MKKNIKHVALLLFLSLLLVQCKARTKQIENQVDKTYSEWMAESEMERRDDEPHWSYVSGLVNTAILNVWEINGNQKYYDYVKTTFVDQLIDSTGNIMGYEKEEFNIDHINAGKMLFPIYEKTGDERYRDAVELLMDQLREHPRVSEGGFWHKKIYTNQMWLDGLYMGAPFYAEYVKNFGDPSAFNDITNQFLLMEKHLLDEETGLYYHGWDESKSIFWADPQTGRSENFWGRGMGWFYMALIDVLDFLPEDHKDREKIVEMYTNLTDALLRYRDEETGLWYQVVNMPNREGNYLESSCASMFTYGMFKGMKKGILDEGNYLQPAIKAYNGILRNFIEVEANGNLTINSVCSVAGLGPEGNTRRDGSFEYYISEPVVSNDGKATGPFILASLMVEINPDWLEKIESK